MMIDGPSYASASRIAFSACAWSAPIAICAQYTYPYVDAINPRSFLRMRFPAAANFAIAPTGVDFDAWPPVFE